MTRPERLGLSLVVVIVAATGCSDRIGKGWDWNRMRTQPRYQPYGDSKFFADGKAMQLPPMGTMSRESGKAAAAPVVVTDALVARGASRFHIYCAVCHGESGDGVSIVASNMEQPKPPSLLVPPASLMPAGVIATVISNGAGTMPSFAAELSYADRQAVAIYVRALQSKAAMRAAAGLAKR